MKKSFKAPWWNMMKLSMFGRRVQVFSLSLFGYLHYLPGRTQHLLPARSEPFIKRVGDSFAPVRCKVWGEPAMNSEGVTVTGAEEFPVCNAQISFDLSGCLLFICEIKMVKRKCFQSSWGIRCSSPLMTMTWMRTSWEATFVPSYAISLPLLIFINSEEDNMRHQPSPVVGWWEISSGCNSAGCR